ncbi:pilus assembly protein [Castellaniella hirudinis]|uniref:pilus assembly protein n=1 Tax=Castellaniella hirudinis TaxID=1144617 RepID=UPI0039C23529
MNRARMHWAAWRARLDAWRFAGQRADYFEYLHAVLTASQGRLTLRELFDRDALRYGPGTVRGRLSRAWSLACEASGGDLQATWRGCFPADERALVQVSQLYGNARLLACFQSLARHLGLLLRARRLLWGTLGTAAVALLLVCALVWAVPVWTIPSLQQAFQGLPEAFYGPYARALFAGARLAGAWGAVLPVAALGAVAATIALLPKACGPGRQVLDRFGPWRLYRQIQALRLMALIAIVLQPGPGGAAQLRAVLVLLMQRASPWMAAHLRRMVGNLDQGLSGAAALDTGLLDRDLYWYLQDLDAAHGLQPALLAVHARMATVWFARIRLQAQAMRWLVLLAGVACVLGIGLWHFAAIDELRRAWMMFHASQ